MDAKSIGMDIERIRKRGKFSRKDLAMIAEVGSTAIYELEKGSGKTKLETLLKVLNALNIKLTLTAPFTDYPARES